MGRMTGRFSKSGIWISRLVVVSGSFSRSNVGRLA
jgi:hypothetical protein